MKFASLSSKAAFAALAAILLIAAEPSPRPAQPLALPPGSGAWVAQVVIAGGTLYKAKSYSLDSTGKGLFEYVAPGQNLTPTPWKTAGTNLGAVAKSIAVAKPSAWQHLAHVCCNKYYEDVNLTVREPDGTVAHYHAGWPTDQSFRAQIDAATISANLLRAYNRATNASAHRHQSAIGL